MGASLVMVLAMVGLMGLYAGHMMDNAFARETPPHAATGAVGSPEGCPMHADSAHASSAGVGSARAAGTHAAEVNASETWACPMHPEVTSDAPGSCPKCGMNLVARAAPDSATATNKPHGCCGAGGTGASATTHTTGEDR